jgi:hypothetical protein
MRIFGLVAGSVLAVGMASAAAAADAALIDGNSVDEILNLARGYGSATLGAQDSGEPKIYGKIEGQPYTIYFSSCDKDSHKDCEDLDFHSGYLGIKPTQERINAWNRDTRFARAYLDGDGDAGMDMDVNLEHGVSSDNLDSTLSLWAQLVKKFTAYVNETQ